MANPRVLVIAEAANPEWVSVPLVGWYIATSLRDVANVHIVTQIRNREAFLRSGLIEGVDFTAIDSEAIAAPFYRLAERLRGGSGKGWTTLTAMQSLTYPYFEHLVWKRFGEQIKAGVFDIVHRVTPLSPTSPSSLARRCKKIGVPFMLGPLNGGLPWPKGFTEDRVREREWLSFVRGAYALLPMVASTYKHAEAVIVGSHHTERELAHYGASSVYIPENGIDSKKFRSRNNSAQEAPTIKAVFVGRLVPYKGADLAMRSCAELAAQGMLTLDIVGDGPEMGALQELCDQLGLRKSIKFHGWLSHADVGEQLSNADLLVFPSIREFGGGVVLEAMASGVVPVVVDYGGPGELVTADCGVKVHLGAKDQIVTQISNALRDLCLSPRDLARMRQNAQNRIATHYTWNAKAKQIRKIYDWILSGDKHQPAPSFEFFGGD